jgi:hypothetical protein
MGYTHSPQIVLDGLTMVLDAANSLSFRGIPTTNLLANSGMSTYNNVGGDVISNLGPTTETYRGAVVWKQTLTAISANGVSWLSNGNNPGIGVVTGGGGGLANRYTGHSIFFRPTVAMHSAPIFTCYSNIGGWQSCGNYDDMGDGWFRANVIWFNTVDGNDGKYWAINPLLATINVPIDIYWAGPFKEDRNDSQVVSPFVNGVRGTTVATGGGWADRSKGANNGELVNGVGYNSSNLGGLVFDGVDDYVTAPNTSLIHRTSNWAYSAWVNFNGTPSLGTIFENGSWTSCLLIRFETNGITIYSMSSFWGKFNLSPTLGIWYKLDFIRNGNSIDFYLNGVYSQSLSFTADIQPSSNLFIGMSQHAAGQCFNGKIAQASIYNRALTPSEINQIYNATKGRFGL